MTYENLQNVPIGAPKKALKELDEWLSDLGVQLIDKTESYELKSWGRFMTIGACLTLTTRVILQIKKNGLLFK